MLAAEAVLISSEHITVPSIIQLKALIVEYYYQNYQ